jgi:hypothetical protein
MRLAIMQPYFFPYIGYFQLMSAVDHFLIHDDVQWIKGGWINRNRISVHGREQMLTLPVESGGNNGLICHRKLAADFDRQRERMLRLLREAYQRAPQFDSVFSLVHSIMHHVTENACDLIVFSLRQTASYIGIRTSISRSSELAKDETLRAEDRVLELCRLCGAVHYINPIGGVELYSKQRFEEQGIGLSFLQPGITEYRQLRLPFLPALSILDVMMFSSPEQVRAMLAAYELQ